MKHTPKPSTFIQYVAMISFLIALTVNLKFTINDQLTITSNALLAQESCSEDCDDCPEGEHCVNGECVEDDPSEEEDHQAVWITQLCVDGSSCTCTICMMGDTGCNATCPCCP
jgi:hypothetical protein